MSNTNCCFEYFNLTLKDRKGLHKSSKGPVCLSKGSHLRSSLALVSHPQFHYHQHHHKASLSLRHDGLLRGLDLTSLMPPSVLNFLKFWPV